MSERERYVESISNKSVYDAQCNITLYPNQKNVEYTKV